MMDFTRRAVLAASLSAAGAFAAGLGANAAADQPPRPGRPKASTPDAPPEAAPGDDLVLHRRSVNNLRFLALALHSYHNVHDQLPPAAISDPRGKPLLSWRVALLPYLGEEALYGRFRLDEPWDSPHNKELLGEMPDVYAPVTRQGRSKDATYYQAFVGPGTLYEGDRGTAMANVPDGLGVTILVAEAARPVPWTKPEDLAFDPEKPLPKLGGLFDDGFHVIFVDGTSMLLGKDLDPRILRGLITRAGGEAIDAGKLRP